MVDISRPSASTKRPIHTGPLVNTPLMSSDDPPLVGVNGRGNNWNVCTLGHYFDTGIKAHAVKHRKLYWAQAKCLNVFVSTCLPRTGVMNVQFIRLYRLSHSHVIGMLFMGYSNKVLFMACKQLSEYRPIVWFPYGYVWTHGRIRTEECKSSMVTTWKQYVTNLRNWKIVKISVFNLGFIYRIKLYTNNKTGKRCWSCFSNQKINLGIDHD